MSAKGNYKEISDGITRNVPAISLYIPASFALLFRLAPDRHLCGDHMGLCFQLMDVNRHTQIELQGKRPGLRDVNPVAVVAMAPNVDGSVGNDGRAKDSQWTPHRPTGVALGTFPLAAPGLNLLGG